MAKNTIVFEAEGKKHTFKVVDVIRVLRRVARRIYVDRFGLQLQHFLAEEVSGSTRGIFYREQFINMLKPRDGQLHIAFSIPCSEESARFDGSIETAIGEIISTQKHRISGLVHGATFAGAIPFIHSQAHENGLLSIGVMPWCGLVNLLENEHLIPDDYKPMHYLAIEGVEYGEHADLFGSLPREHDRGIGMVFGGREGALAEIEASSRHGKYIFNLPIENSLATQTIMDGCVVFESPDEISGFMQANINSGQKIFHGKTSSVNQFETFVRKRQIVNIGFVSNSGVPIDYVHVRDILIRFLHTAITGEYRNRAQPLSGLTAYSGIWELYIACREVGLIANGLICRKGMDCPWADASRVVSIGQDWSDESQAFTTFSHVLLAYAGGGQAKNEIKRALESGGPRSFDSGIPVIALWDEHVGGATQSLLDEGFTHPNLHFYHTLQVIEAAEHMQVLIDEADARYYR